MTAATRIPANFSPTERACLGSQASSPMSTLRFFPSTPPAALISATACSAPFFNCVPNEAYWPVIGPANAMGMSCATAGPARRPKKSAQALSRSLVISVPLLVLSSKAFASVKNLSPLPFVFLPDFAPAERTRAGIEPGILPHHLARPRGAPADQADGEKDHGVAAVGCRRQKFPLEQGVMNEACRGAQQQCGDGNLPGRAPSAGDGTAGEPGGAAAEDCRHQDNVRDALAGIKPVHFRSLSARAAFEVGGANFRPLQQFASGAGQRDLAVDHDITAMRELERMIGVLLDQEHRELVALIERANGGKNLLH